MVHTSFAPDASVHSMFARHRRRLATFLLVFLGAGSKTSLKSAGWHPEMARSRPTGTAWFCPCLGSSPERGTERRKGPRWPLNMVRKLKPAPSGLGPVDRGGGGGISTDCSTKYLTEDSLPLPLTLPYVHFAFLGLCREQSHKHTYSFSDAPHSSIEARTGR